MEEWRDSYHKVIYSSMYVWRWWLSQLVLSTSKVSMCQGQHTSSDGILYFSVSSAETHWKYFIAITTNFLRPIFLNLQLPKNLYDVKASVVKTQAKRGCRNQNFVSLGGRRHINGADVYIQALSIITSWTNVSNWRQVFFQTRKLTMLLCWMSVDSWFG
jgi:hypothetical protein